VINVIETKENVPTPAIFYFHSTFVMNYVTWNALVCAYPRMTADRRGYLNIWQLDVPSQIVRCIIKYVLRRFRYLERGREWFRGGHNCKGEGYCCRSPRCITDKYTMRYAFAGEPEDGPDVIDSGLTWMLNSRYGCGPDRRFSPTVGYVRKGEANA
jgi:hypothetical protein